MKEKKKPWGGRFTEPLSSVAERLSASVHFDARLYRQDIRGSKAHAKMLKSMGILAADELDSVIKGLEAIEKEIDSGTFPFSAALEDVHMNIESRLTEMIGEAGKKLHTARSRNDQVALDVRMYVRDEASAIRSLLLGLMEAIIGRAEQHIDVVLPGYTHLQIAQPVRLSHHLMVYAWMLWRDLARLDAASVSADRLPLGSGALAGVNYANDREFLRRELGFSQIIANSMDAVSDRDFLLDFLYFAAVLGTHCSRICEELVLWSTAEFGYIRLADAVTTGSSIMPQKRNPDIAELIRGKTGRLYGDLVSLLTLLKGLPLTYNRDLQEDKEPLFDAVDTVKVSLEGMAEMIRTMEVKEDRMRQSLLGNYSTATDLADYLAQKGVPFRSCHEIVGSIVKHCETKNIDFFKLDLASLRTFSDAFDEDALAMLYPATSPERKRSMGSTARDQVLAQMASLRRLMAASRQ